MKQLTVGVETIDEDGNLVEPKEWTATVAEPIEWLAWVRENWPLVLIFQGALTLAVLLFLFAIIILG